MPTLTVIYGRPTDREAFRRHYEQVHVPLARALPRASNLTYSLDVQTLAGEPSVHAVFRATFDTRQDLDDALASPQGQAAQADVPNFATGGVTILVEND